MLSNCVFLAKDKKSDEMEIKTDEGKLTIASFAIVWVANLSNCTSLKRKNRKVTERLSNCASLARDEKGDEIELKTDRSKLTIALFIFVGVANISDWQWNRKLVME